MKKALLSCLASLRSTFRQIHPVDRSLLFFMLILLVQSAFSIFFPSGSNHIAGDIDVIVRTSCASIFGYFLSANLARRTSSSGQAPLNAQGHILNVGSDLPKESLGPRAQIGFSMGNTQTQAAESGVESHVSLTDSHPAKDFQITAATLIGLFCLAILLALRYAELFGFFPIESDSMASTVIQFRDFIAGCVGFLIGYPSQQSN